MCERQGSDAGAACDDACHGVASGVLQIENTALTQVAHNDESRHVTHTEHIHVCQVSDMRAARGYALRGKAGSVLHVE
jgi:hypothetical protein